MCLCAKVSLGQKRAMDSLNLEFWAIQKLWVLGILWNLRDWGSQPLRDLSSSSNILCMITFQEILTNTPVVGIHSANSFLVTGPVGSQGITYPCLHTRLCCEK